MKYDFTKHERDFDRFVFALTLDRKKLTERIIIARYDEVRLRLECGAGEVFYDETRSLGSFLINFESDKAGAWNKNGVILRESYSKAILRKSVRRKFVEPVADFLSTKCDSGEPSLIFAAIKTWDEYLNCFNLNHGADLLTEKLSVLYKPFAIYANFKPWQDRAVESLTNANLDGESSVEIWYATGKRKLETVVTSSSLLPIITYYLHKIEEWEFVFQGCKVCGKDFLAKSRHYELCSDKCRKVRALENKREFDERTKGDKLEQLHESAYYYWYN